MPDDPDKIYEAALRKLYYEPMTDLEIQGATIQRIAEDERLKAKNDSIGSEVFRDVETSDLTPTQKQDIHKKIAQYGMQQEVGSPGVDTNPNTLLRANNRYTNYTSAYLNQYGSGYVEGVRNLAIESSTQVPIPKSAVGKVGKSFDVVENAFVTTNAEQLRDNVKAALKKQGVPDNVVNQVDAVFKTRAVGQGGLRPVDKGLKDDMDQFLKQNGVKTEGVRGVDEAFQTHYTKLDKITNLAGGHIPPQDMPPDGNLVAYLDKHGFSSQLTAEDRTALKGLKVVDFQTLHKMQVDIAHRTVDATAKNLSQLTPEARAFLQAGFQPITDPTARNVAGASTLVLRLNSPKVSMDGQNLGHDPSTSDLGALMDRGAKTVQRYVNALGVGSTDKHDYATLGCNDLLKDGTLGKQTLDSYKAVGEGQNLDTFSRTAGGPLAVAEGSRSQVTKLRNTADVGGMKNPSRSAKLQDDYNKIQAAQTKLDKLNKPGVNFEKFKALFGKGGVQGAKTETQNKVTELQESLKEKLANNEKETQQQKQVQLLKQAKSRQEKVKSELPSLSQEETGNLLDKLDSLSPERTNKVPSRFQMSHEDAGNLLDTLDSLSPERTNKVPSRFQMSRSEAGNLLDTLDKLSPERTNQVPSRLQISSEDAETLMKGLEKLKGDVQLKKTEDVGVEVDDQSQEESLDGFDLSDSDFSNMLEKLKEVSPETWEQVEEIADTELSVEEIGDLIKELEELDLSEEPTQKIKGEATSEEIADMIKELEELDLSETPKENLRKSVGTVLDGTKEKVPSQKPRSNSLRSTNPELVRGEVQKTDGPGVKVTKL